MAALEQAPLHYLIGELKARLGFSAGVVSAAQTATLTSFLTRAQEWIYSKYDLASLKETDESINTVANTITYAWPTTVNPRRLISHGVYCKWDSNQWAPLARGIEWEHDSVTAAGHTSYPERWDFNEGDELNQFVLELWPKPNGVYPIRIEALRPIGNFLTPSDWVADTATAVGDLVKPTGCPSYPTALRAKDRLLAECTAVAADTKTHATTEPTWPTTPGQTVVDDQVTWTMRLNVTTVDQDLVLGLALARAKAHYRQADAEIEMNSVLDQIQQASREGKTGRRYVRGEKPYRPPLAFPNRV